LSHPVCYQQHIAVQYAAERLFYCLWSLSYSCKPAPDKRGTQVQQLLLCQRLVVDCCINSACGCDGIDSCSAADAAGYDLAPALLQQVRRIAAVAVQQRLNITLPATASAAELWS
jgi:hypothetical protein